MTTDAARLSSARAGASVALCTHNGEAFLEVQLRSLLAQTRLPDEIVVVDDCSFDTTIAIVERVSRDAAVPIRLHRNAAQLGVTANFEKAISLTQHDIVFLCDQDDIWYPDKVETMLAEFASRPELWFLHADARLVDDDGLPIGSRLLCALEIPPADRRRVHRGAPFDVYIRRNLATGATAAFRRELFAKARPFPADWLHDEWLAIIAAAFGAADFLERPVIDYRQHASNHMGVQPPTPIHKIRQMFTRRGDFHHRMVRRVRSLHGRLVATGAPAPCLAKTADKLAHAVARANLPPQRLMRLGTMAHEAFSGRYWRWSSGLRSMLRDLTESIPADGTKRRNVARVETPFDRTTGGTPIAQRHPAGPSGRRSP